MKPLIPDWLARVIRIIALFIALVCFVLNAFWVPSGLNLLGFGLVFLTVYFVMIELRRENP